ncbi:MAG: amidohydrolase family protein [Planctomycetes bacterium]|nr:amidohydrolase family protein [Planctomycetota bacterium]
MPLAEEMKRYVDQIPFFDTHSHVAGFDFGSPLDDKQGRSLPQILMNDYLAYLASSCFDDLQSAFKNGGWTVGEAEAHFQAIQPLLARYRHLSTYAVLREGIRELHHFEGADITMENWKKTNEKVVEAYRTHGERAWQRAACQRAGVARQTQICFLPYVTDHWGQLPAEERKAQSDYLAPSLVLDGYLFTGFASNKIARARSKELLNFYPTTHREYLEFCGRVFDLFHREGGKSVKLLAAYTRSIRFEEVPDSAAADLFSDDPEKLSGDRLRLLQDNLLWHLLEMAVARRLPLIVHTGYNWPTEWGHPENLMNILRSPRLRGLKVDLCHSGWPNHGEALILARTYRGCFFNLCWTPMLSPELGRHILSMAIDMLPRNKILMGTDCGTAEAFVGTVRLIRNQIAEVLAEKVLARQFSAEIARELARAILWDNPCEFYGMS